MDRNVMEDRMFNENHMSEHLRWHELSAGRKWLAAAHGLVFAAIVVALAGLAVMLLWNWIMSRVLGLPAFGFWNAAGLFVLCRILVGFRAPSFVGRMRMKRIMRERMAKMESSSEEGSID